MAAGPPPFYFLLVASKSWRETLCLFTLCEAFNHTSRTSAKFASMPAGPMIPAHLSERIYQQVGLAAKDSQRLDCRIKKRRLDSLSVEVLLVRMKSNGACNKARPRITFKQPFTLSPSARLKAVQFQEQWERNTSPKCWAEPATALHQKSSDHKECECSPWGTRNYSTFMSPKLPTSSNPKALKRSAQRNDQAVTAVLAGLDQKSQRTATNATDSQPQTETLCKHYQIVDLWISMTFVGLLYGFLFCFKRFAGDSQAIRKRFKLKAMTSVDSSSSNPILRDSLPARLTTAWGSLD